MMASETAAATGQSANGTATPVQPVHPAQPVPDANTGIYAYNVIEAGQPATFGTMDIGGRGDEVYTIHFRDLAAVDNKTPLVMYDSTRENAVVHEHVT